jgi:hypothetical protein
VKEKNWSAGGWVDLEMLRACVLRWRIVVGEDSGTVGRALTMRKFQIQFDALEMPMHMVR